MNWSMNGRTKSVSHYEVSRGRFPESIVVAVTVRCLAVCSVMDPWRSDVSRGNQPVIK